MAKRPIYKLVHLKKKEGINHSGFLNYRILRLFLITNLCFVVVVSVLSVSVVVGIITVI